MVNKKEFLTIITATYNRSAKLRELYISLLKQTNTNFKWLILDDGSVDDTRELQKGFVTNLFEIIYFYQENSGKHKIINRFINLVSTDLVFIVDSDDLLIPDAVETIYLDWTNKNDKLIGLSFLRKDTRGSIIGDEFTSDRLISTHSKERIINNVKGDKAEVWRTSEFKRIPFLEFDNERFFSEQHKYLALSGPGKILFVNKAIYICEYLEGGLSSRIRQLQFENPSGTLANAVPLTQKVYSINTRLKAFLKVYAFSHISGVRFLTVFRDCDYEIHWLLLTPLGSIYKYYLILNYNFHKLFKRS